MFPFSLLAAESSQILASIKPLQSIIANLTKDVDNNIGLIIDKNESLHNYHLKPTKIKQIHESKIVILIDRNFEIFLDKIIYNLNDKNHLIIEVAKLPNVRLRGMHDHDHNHNHEHGHSHDYHIWLDVSIVKIFSTELVKLLSKENPQYKKQYEKNLKDFLLKLDNLDKNIKAKIGVARNKNFIVTHNAYDYFISRYGLNSPDSITIDHDHNIGARTFLELQEKMKNNNVSCIFEEPQFESNIMRKLKENTNIKLGVLDAEWGPNDASIEDNYFEMMNSLMENFIKCLS